ncbi:MAG: hypothetical protein E6X17_08475 [Sporomusaceae bacterium]|nr:hypothetical protein [Sporomusaceae bacterium]
MEKILQQLLDGQRHLFEGQQQILNRMDKLEQKFDALDQKVSGLEEKVAGLEVSLQENVAITKSIQHWTEEIQAQFHGMGHTLNRIEGKVSQLEKQQDIIKADISFLTRKAAEQDEAMYRLQRAR